MKLNRLLLIITIISLIPNPILGQLDLTASVDNILSKHSDAESTGLSIVISEKDKLIYSNQLGLSNLEYDLPLTEQTKFQAGFLSQQFTAYAVLLLEQDGELSLEDDIANFIPEFNQDKDSIKIQDLLAHTSGLYDYWSLKAIAGWRNDEFFDKQLALDYATNQTNLNQEPGKQAYFSNTNYLLLAEIVSKVSGKSFKDFVIERITTPLNLSNTFLMMTSMLFTLIERITISTGERVGNKKI